MLVTINEVFNNKSKKHVADAAEATAHYFHLKIEPIKDWLTMPRAMAFLSLPEEEVYYLVGHTQLLNGFEILDYYIGSVPVYKVYIHQKGVVNIISKKYRRMLLKCLQESKPHLQVSHQKKLQGLPEGVH